VGRGRGGGRSDLSEVRSSSARRALIVFAVVEAAGLVTYLVIGRHMWFFGDEWSVLASRGAGEALHQHGGHLIALPFLALRFLYFGFGLRSYVPYMLTVIVLHLVIAALLRVIMRRAGVGPWIATTAATLYVFFGAGGQNILWAFQMTLAGAVAFGLAQLLFADHDGPIDRRDWIGLGFGLLAVLCSGAAVTMVAVVGIAALIRGRWRAALFHTVPLGLLWFLWSLRYGVAGKYIGNPRVLFNWDRRGIAASFRSLGYVAPVGWAIAAMLIAGLVLARRRSQPTGRGRAALPLATLAGAVLFVTITGVSRSWFGLHGATSSRYLDVVAALLLPAIAVAGDALARRNRLLLPVVLALLVVGIPGNISQTRDSFPGPRYFARYRQMMLSLPRMSLAKRVPGSVHPEPNQAPLVTVSWLLDAARSGRLPKTRPPTPSERLTNNLRLSLAQTLGSAGSDCRTLRAPVFVDVSPGQKFSVKGTAVISATEGAVRSDRLVFGSGFLTGSREHKLADVGRPLALRIERAPNLAWPAVCGLPVSDHRSPVSG
jgi:hypothetical protein